MFPYSPILGRSSIWDLKFTFSIFFPADSPITFSFCVLFCGYDHPQSVLHVNVLYVNIEVDFDNARNIHIVSKVKLECKNLHAVITNVKHL